MVKNFKMKFLAKRKERLVPFCLFILVMLGLCCCARASLGVFSICLEQGLLLVAEHMLLTAVASFVVKHRL